MGTRTFVGFGFGPIQAGLFLLEAQASGNFGRFVVSEIDTQLVEAVRRNAHRCIVNVAHADGVEHHELTEIELYNPAMSMDQHKLEAAITGASEMATALPSVAVYPKGGEGSVLSLLHEGLSRRVTEDGCIVYAAENNNHAAQILEKGLAEKAGGRLLDGFQALDTVIGKMSGVISGREEMEKLGLKPLAPGVDRAFLVEEFNRILIDEVLLPDFERGITAFEEKSNLMPFEEAKLHGHNAIHALIAYLAALRGHDTIAEAGPDKAIMALAREAFLDECGAALVHKHAGLGDPLFREDGFREYATDLLRRMVNPYLHDLVERVGRDPVRKLGYTDRLYGTMRLALGEGVEPKRLGIGAAAGVVHLFSSEADRARLDIKQRKPDEAAIRALLPRMWERDKPEADEAEKLVTLTIEGLRWLRQKGWA